MRYLIDGYNLFFAIHDTIDPLKEQRNLLIQSLNTLLAPTQNEVILIFDSSLKHATYVPTKQQLKALIITFSPEGLSADDYILELLRFNAKATIVITSDSYLSQQVQALGAKTQKIEPFLYLLMKKKSPISSSHEKKQEVESPAQYQRLLKAFEKRLKQHNDRSQHPKKRLTRKKEEDIEK